MPTEIRPQPQQVSFLTSKADITIFGGAAGGGKSFALLLTPLPYASVKKFGAVIFRRDYGQIFAEGALWDEAVSLYIPLGNCVAKRNSAEVRFLSLKGDTISKISFRHIARDDELSAWQGSQIAEICFDELTHFSETTFFYMLSRNRSICGVRPYIRATCNPDADSWVARFISWWIDQDTGYPIKERSGRMRWFLRRENEIHWADTPDELCDRFCLKTREERAEPKSVSFIMSTVYDNQILLKANPQYLANLKALPIVARERLLMGNWKIRPTAGTYFKREQIASILPFAPLDVVRWARGWDLAATAESEGGDADYTAGVLIGKRSDGRYVVVDVANARLSAADVRATLRFTAESDKAKLRHVKIRIPQDPGQAGKAQAQSLIKHLSGHAVKAVAESGSKATRAEPFAAQWQAGNVDVVAGEWNEAYFTQLEGFPDANHDDMVDASSAAFAELEEAEIKEAGTW